MKKKEKYACSNTYDKHIGLRLSAFKTCCKDYLLNVIYGIFLPKF